MKNMDCDVSLFRKPGAAGAGKVYGTGVTEEGIEDRVYRLHYNAGQNRTDKFAAVRSLLLPVQGCK